MILILSTPTLFLDNCYTISQDTKLMSRTKINFGWLKREPVVFRFNLAEENILRLVVSKFSA